MPRPLFSCMLIGWNTCSPFCKETEMLWTTTQSPALDAVSDRLTRIVDGVRRETRRMIGVAALAVVVMAVAQTSWLLNVLGV